MQKHFFKCTRDVKQDLKNAPPGRIAKSMYITRAGKRHKTSPEANLN